MCDVAKNVNVLNTQAIIIIPQPHAHTTVQAVNFARGLS
jgi:hypothetical protein